MFKARLINDLEYYEKRRKVLFLSFLSSTFLGPLSVAILPTSFSWTMIFIGVAGILFFGWMSFRNQKQIDALSLNQKIEIDTHQIGIIAINAQNSRLFSISDIDKIEVKKEYNLTGESMGDIGKELKGNYNQNFITIENDGKRERFDFEVDSNYMLVQMEKIVNSWIENEVNVVRV